MHADDVIFDDITDQPILGRSAVQAYLEARREVGRVLTFDTCEAVVLGDWCYTSGTWRLEPPDGGVSRGSYLHVIKPVNGELKILRDIFYVTEWKSVKAEHS